MMTAADNTRLWPFALTLYSQPDVKSLCLALQDSEGVDVCLLLCTAWLSVRGIHLDRRRLAALEAVGDPWRRQVLLPLRQVRRHLREPAKTNGQLATCRESVKAAELAAEQWLLQRYENLAHQWPVTEAADPDLAAVECYLQTVSAPAVVRRALAQLRNAMARLTP